jgi:hypothetical protein
MARTFLVVAGCYLASLVLAFIYLAAGAALAGKSVSAGERGVVVVLLAATLTFLASSVTVFVGIGRGVSSAARIGISVGYCVAALATLLVFAVVSLVVFNR